MRLIRPKSKTERDLAQTQQDLLDTQELAANQFEENQKLNASLLDTQELITQLIENGGIS